MGGDERNEKRLERFMLIKAALAFFYFSFAFNK